MDKGKYEKLPHDRRNRIDETKKKPHNKITTPHTILSTITHPRPETIDMNYLYTHQISKAYIKMIEISSSK
jgi:hypothetical protein